MPKSQVFLRKSIGRQRGLFVVAFLSLQCAVVWTASGRLNAAASVAEKSGFATTGFWPVGRRRGPVPACRCEVCKSFRQIPESSLGQMLKVCRNQASPVGAPNPRAWLWQKNTNLPQPGSRGLAPNPRASLWQKKRMWQFQDATLAVG